METAELRLLVDSSDFRNAERDMQGFERSARSVEQSAQRAGRSTSSMGSGAQQAGIQVSRLTRATSGFNQQMREGANKWGKRGFVGLAGIMTAGIYQAQKFETAMAEINKTVDFTSKNGMANMRKELEKLTTQIPQSFSELANIAATGGQLGIAERDITSFTETVAKMGIAFDMPAQQAAESMAKLANVFKIPIKDIGELGDAINTLSNNTPAKADQIVNALGRVGGIGKVFGLTKNQLISLSGAFIAMGKSPEVASTSINSMLTTFSTLDNASKTQRRGFEALGVDITTFSELVKTDGQGAILSFLDAVNKLPQADRIGAIASIIGKESGDDITLLASNVGMYRKQIELLADSTKYAGSMNKEFLAISDTSANKMKLFGNNINVAMAALGDALIPTLNSILESFMPKIQEMGGWFKANKEEISSFASGLSDVASLIGDVVIPVFNLVKTVTETFAGGIAATVIGMQDFGSYISTEFSEIMNGMPVEVQTAMSAVGAVFSSTWETIKSIFTGSMEAIGALLSGDMSRFSEIVSNGFNNIIGTVDSGMNFLPDIVRSGWELVKGIFVTTLQAIGALLSLDFSGFVNIIKDGMGKALFAIKNIIDEIVGAFANLGKLLYESGKNAVSGLINGIKSRIGETVSAARNLAKMVSWHVNDKLKVRSPSRVMMQTGGFVAAGLALGIANATPVAVSAASKMANDVKESVSVLSELPLKVNLGAEITLLDGATASLKKQTDEWVDSQKKAAKAVTAGLKSELNTWSEAQIKFGNSIARVRGKLTKSQRASNNALVRSQKQANSALIRTHKREMNALIKQKKDAAAELIKQHKQEYKEIINKHKAFAGLAKSQLTDGEKTLSTLQKQLAVIKDMQAVKDAGKSSVAQAVIDETKSRAINKAVGIKDAPNFAPSLGAFDGIAKVDKQKEELKTWHTDKLELMNSQQMREQLSAKEHAEKMIEIESHLAEQKRFLTLAGHDALLAAGEATFAKLTGSVKAYAGENSKAYRAMFAIEKGFAIARSVVAIQQGIAMASANPFPMNLGAIASVAAATGSIVSTIASVAMPAGQAHHGIDKIPEDGTWNLKKGERVSTAETSAKLDRTLAQVQQKLSDKQQAQQASGQNIKIVNNIDPSVMADYLGSDEGERVIVNMIKRNPTKFKHALG